MSSTRPQAKKSQPPRSESSGYCLGTLDEQNRQLLATLGHELRNPLGTMRSVLGLLADEPGDPEARARLYTVLQRQVHHLEVRAQSNGHGRGTEMEVFLPRFDGGLVSS